MTANDNWLNGKVVGLSVSDSADLAGLGFGREHMREVLLRIAQSALRARANLAYGGNFKHDSFTRDLILLINEEQHEDISDQEHWSGILYNHSPWPYYEDITDEDEAEYIDACRFIKITREMAGIIPGELEKDDADRVPAGLEVVHKAIVLSAMRRFMALGLTLETAAPGIKETIPPVSARVLIGGKTQEFTGMLPGLYEEALYCLEKRAPLFLVGGFGGAAANLAGYIDKSLDVRSAELDLEHLRNSTPALGQIEAALEACKAPEDIGTPGLCLERLMKQLNKAKTNLSRTLNNGLAADENKLLFKSTDAAESAALVLRGLRKKFTTPTKSKPKPKTPQKKPKKS